jgi:hypothetical protein
MGGNIARAVDDPSDDGAQGEMLLAAAYAGIGFGNASMHLSNGMSHPVSGMVWDYLLVGSFRCQSPSLHTCLRPHSGKSASLV